MKSSRRILFIALVFCSVVGSRAIAQDFPTVSVGFNFFNLVHARTPAVAGIAEMRFTEHFAVRVDGGVMFDGVHNDRININSYTGFQVGAGLRTYFFHTDIEDVYSLYGEFRVKHKNYRIDITADFDISDQYGIYKRRDNYIADISEYNVQFGFGQKVQVDAFRMDFIVGIGPADVRIDYTLPANATYRTNGSSLWEPDRTYDKSPWHIVFLEFVLGYTFGSK